MSPRCLWDGRLGHPSPEGAPSGCAQIPWEPLGRMSQRRWVCIVPEVPSGLAPQALNSQRCPSGTCAPGHLPKAGSFGTFARFRAEPFSIVLQLHWPWCEHAALHLVRQHCTPCTCTLLAHNGARTALRCKSVCVSSPRFGRKPRVPKQNAPPHSLARTGTRRHLVSNTRQRMQATP